ncbi:hypothetical protein HOU00_gp339 [Caulobacter phage CcrPW]|uniref:Uncharacterized protein n=1 Tax=Caulobacter phage CcrPW TaxID=2283271 RepID=A0A385EAM2_9CAUD|nr:hypothetical protein HOU00_gp339 [Caulobacter phage CcrPW]AXQ68786.1 hypothetical protein CcrPW_gp247 [Caulobacter phage CcrPW]
MGQYIWHDLPLDERLSKPKVDDRPGARLKAEDARGLLHFPDRLGDLLTLKACLAGAKIVFSGNGYAPSVTAWGWTPRDQEVIEDYVKRRVEKNMGGLTARQGLVLLAVRNDGSVDVATWGKSSQDCKVLGELGSKELGALPSCPFQTWWGWGNGGVPKRFPAQTLKTLSENTQAYVKKNTHPGAVG